eukprot:11191192-Prorocentrum_lima.AAC.1
MTSSLVGSEMCIRDRDVVARPKAESRYAEVREVQEQHERTVEGIFLGSVSYTHLTLPTICSV